MRNFLGRKSAQTFTTRCVSLSARYDVIQTKNVNLLRASLTSPLLLRIPENLEALEAEVALARQVIAELVERAGQQIDRLKLEKVVYGVYLDFGKLNIKTTYYDTVGVNTT